MRRLVQLEVRGLLDRFDHVIDFPPSWEFIILHGPNGVGKTRILELITYTFAMNVQRLSRVPFQAARFEFDDGSQLTLDRTNSRQLELVERDVEYEDLRRPVFFGLSRSGDLLAEWSGDRLSSDQLLRCARVIEREILARRVAPRSWRISHTGETIGLEDLVDRYFHLLPPHMAQDILEAEAPEPLQLFCQEMNVHLIETQRLVTRDSSEDHGRARGEASQRPTAVRYAEDLRTRLHAALANNSRTTQQLDRTFPKRILDAKLSSDIDDDAIRRRYEEQSQLRSRLSAITLLEERADLPLPDRDLQAWERRVLWTYLEDTDAKLSTFQTLLEKVDIFREIVSSRFLYKRIFIDSDVGFRVETDEGKAVPPASLSSGEQHELILVYDLLFNAPENSLVLIDEPEISLHVAWQQQFLSDLIEISALTPLKFMIATHSPQIIHKWWERTVRLAPGFDGG